jgi:alkanesulfonate monooxygenase SsuD/methylene tetrahydromethanopterin reductase-like flavin-dependent oxidoreductase (luciferase family)
MACLPYHHGLGASLNSRDPSRRTGRQASQSRYYTPEDALFEPKPVHGHMPILIGAAGRRMLRHVTRYAQIGVRAFLFNTPFSSLPPLFTELAERVIPELRQQHAAGELVSA